MGNKKKKKLSIGFTNCFAICIMCVILMTIIMGFFLALKSIQYNYVGPLICFTATIAPLDTALSIVLGKVVDKNKAENIGGNGDGITFAAAQASNFVQTDFDVNSPMI